MATVRHDDCGKTTKASLSPAEESLVVAGKPLRMSCRACGATMNVKYRLSNVDAPGAALRLTGTTVFEERHSARTQAVIGCLGILGVIALIGVATWFFFIADMGNDEASAKLICRDFVEDALAYPDEADFASDFAERTGEKTWRVEGIVEAEGTVVDTKIRYNYICELEYQGDDEWELTEDLQLS